jgi:hypothetical protein
MVAKPRWRVGTGRVLLVAGEALAAIALGCQFLLPIEWIASIGFGHRDFPLARIPAVSQYRRWSEFDGTVQYVLATRALHASIGGSMTAIA